MSSQNILKCESGCCQEQATVMIGFTRSDSPNSVPQGSVFCHAHYHQIADEYKQMGAPSASQIVILPYPSDASKKWLDRVQQLTPGESA